MATVAIEITFTEEVLGSSPNTKEIYSEFIASKAPDAASVADEVEAVGADEVTEKGTTVFPRNDDGEPVIWDYQLKGFMKDACGALRRVPGTLSSKCKAYKKVIDGTIFVKERSVAFQLPEGGEVGICERPLRADTPAGGARGPGALRDRPGGDEDTLHVGGHEQVGLAARAGVARLRAVPRHRPVAQQRQGPLRVDRRLRAGVATA